MDPFFNVQWQRVAPEVEYTLCFAINNEHVYPIHDLDEVKNIALKKHMDHGLGSFAINPDYFSFLRKATHAQRNNIISDTDPQL